MEPADEKPAGSWDRKWRIEDCDIYRYPTEYLVTHSDRAPASIPRKATAKRYSPFLLKAVEHLLDAHQPVPYQGVSHGE